MKLLTLSISALTLLQSTIAFAKAKLADSTNSSAQEILAWLETLRFPSLQGCPYVKVTITETNPTPGEKPGFVRVDGFLQKDSGKAFTIFVIALEENLHTYYEMSNPPFWPLTVATFEKAFEKESSKAKERAAYKILALEAEGSALKKELGLPNEDKINTDLWHKEFGRQLSKPAAIAVFASACRQNNLPKLAEELVNGISRTYERYLSTDEKEKPFRRFLDDAISESLLWRATLQFDDPTISRKELLNTFRDLKERFPRSRHQSTIQETIKLLEPMVREDEEHRTKPLSELAEDEQVKELIFQLRDQNGAQEYQPGSCNIFARDDPKSPTSPASQLVKLGYHAVPQLIGALNDERFTRSIGFHRGFYFSHYILRVGDCAEQILERIANRSFYVPDYTAAAMVKDGKASSIKSLAETWWAEFQKKSEKQSLIDAVRAGDENSPAQAEQLLQKYRESAAEAIMTGVRVGKSGRACAALLAFIGTIEGDEIVAFLRKEMKEAPGLEARLIAARGLFDRGNTEAVTAMIEEWKNALPQLPNSNRDHFEPDEVEQLIEFLTNSGRIDAINILAQSLHDVPVDIRTDIVSGFAPKGHKLGVGSWITQEPATSLKRKPPAPDADVDHAAEALIVSLLDDRTLLNRSGGIGEKDIYYSMPRLCDFAGFVLAKRCPKKYQFHWSLYWTENDRQLHEEKNIWRKETGSPLETHASAEKQAATIERDARLSPTRIREINIDSQVDAKTQGRLRSLQGSSLTPEKLSHELKFLTDNLPKNTHGFCFSAERTRDKPGFVIDVRWLERPRSSSEPISGNDVIVENADIQGRPFETDEYVDVANKFKKAQGEDPAKPMAVHFFAAPTSH